MIVVLTVVALISLSNGATVRDTLDVRKITDEADSVIALASRAEEGSALSSSDLAHLSHTIGFEHLQERESHFGGTLSDSALREFVTGLARSGQSAAYQAEVRALENIDVTAAARKASTYLPPGTTLRARLYLEIKPRPNSFVFQGADSLPSIFLAVQPGKSPSQVMNTLTHELHHIGVSAACRRVAPLDSSRVTAPIATLLDYLTAFGEGRAMLAAAGGPNVHPHAADEDSIRQRWDRDVRNAPEDVKELSSFFGAVLDGQIRTADSVTHRGNSYFGVQGPWYTVGWLMASTVERVLGRPALIATTCDPVAFLAAYNEAVARAGTRERLPSWPKSLIRRLRLVEQSLHN
jgi:hypothetical protein